MGETVKIGYVDQRHADIDPNKTVWEVVSGGNEQVEIGGQLFNSRAYVSKFNFNGADQQKKCGVLSGGERNRLHLAMTLKTEANVLLLDEPTNDIDVNTLRALEEGIEGFAGCAVVISHDRYFLDRICTHILAFEGDSQAYWFEGTYSEYEENRKKRLATKAPSASSTASWFGDDASPSVRRTVCPVTHGAVFIWDPWSQPWPAGWTPRFMAESGLCAWTTWIRRGKVEGAADDILRTLEGFGLTWDGPVVCTRVTVTKSIVRPWMR